MKMVIVMRKDLNMRKGKMCAQAGHAVLGAMTTALDMFEKEKYANWYKDNLQTKICLGVDSEQELLNIYEAGLEQGFVVYLVEDYGLTKFHQEHTFTCLAFEPLEDEQIDTITGGLSLL